MKKMLALALVALMAGGALAQAPEIGMFFSDTDFTEMNTNHDVTPGSAFDGYVVVFGTDFDALVAYEVGISAPADIFILEMGGPEGYGWTNFGGSGTNHLVGFQTPLPMMEGGTVVAIGQFLTSSTDPAVFEFGPADPQSDPDWDGALLVDAADVNNPVQTMLVTGEMNGVVATLNGDGVVAVENQTLSGVKALFE
jgi:hypothetical protein